MTVLSFLVSRDDPGRSRWAEGPRIPLAPGEVRLEVERFALTANNVTYADVGEALGYWKFFPGPEGAGIVPVWGFALVVESKHDKVRAGERLFGFLPMATEFTMLAASVTARSLVDARPHRRELPAAYNAYVRLPDVRGMSGEDEDLLALLRPLYTTAFLLEDFLAEKRYFGATQVLVSSASSKTAIALAHRFRARRADGVEVVGLTSGANRGFVASLGCWDRVARYDEVVRLAGASGAVYVDVAGSGAVRRAVHEAWGDRLLHSCALGLSHRDRTPPGSGLPGPKPEFFFAPTRLAKRSGDWGRDGLERRIEEAWSGYLPFAKRNVRVDRGAGAAAIEARWQDMLGGRIGPDLGLILSFG